MRYFFGILMLLTLVLRTTAATPPTCYRFVLKELESAYTWTVDACDAEAEAIREADGVEFIIMDEQINYGGEVVKSTTAALLMEHPAPVEQCWRFVLQPLEGGNTWSVVACEQDAEDVRAGDGLEYIICEEVAL